MKKNKSYAKDYLFYGLISPLIVMLTVSSAAWAGPPIEPILRLEAGMHTAGLWTVDVDEANRYMVTGSNDKTVRVWDLASHRLQRTLRLPIGNLREGEIYSVAISPDGQTIACGGVTGSQWDGTYSIYLFARQSGKLVRRLTGIPGPIGHLAYSKNGQFFATGFWSGVRVYRVPAYHLVGHDNNYGSRCSSAHFGPNGKLVTASWDGFIRLYNVSEMHIRRIAKRKAPSGTTLNSIKFSPDGNKIAASYLNTTNVDIFSGQICGVVCRWTIFICGRIPTRN